VERQGTVFIEQCYFQRSSASNNAEMVQDRAILTTAG